MKRTLALLVLAVFAANIVAQSGRRNVLPPAQPAPPIQAPIFSQPDPEPSSTSAVESPALSGLLPESFRAHSIKALDNGSFRLADFDGKVVVVNLWASWCGPCRSEVPEYEKVRKEYAGREVEFIGLTTEDPNTSSAKVKQFARSVDFGFRLGWADRETVRTLMNGRSIPQTLVIAPGGRIISHWNGYSRGQSGPHLRTTIERALGNKS